MNKNPTEIKECRIHGLTEFALREKGTRWRCRKCGVEAVTKRRLKVKVMSVEYKGGKCELCGYDKCVGSLGFHHKNPNEKDFGIAHKGYTRSWEKIKKELDKCALLCHNCHGEVHAGVTVLKESLGS